MPSQPQPAGPANAEPQLVVNCSREWQWAQHKLACTEARARAAAGDTDKAMHPGFDL
jgi:hypothetical protein